GGDGFGGQEGTGFSSTGMVGKSMISMQSKRTAENINQVYDQQILFTNKIQFERGRIEDLVFRITRAERELEEKRKQVGPDATQGTKGGVSMTDREISKTENRLQQTLTKASTLETANNQRKANVDSLRREKITEVKAKQGLEAELHKTKTSCADMMHLTQQMHDHKEKKRRDIELLKQEVVKDLDNFQGEFRGMTESLAAAKTDTKKSNAKLESLVRIHSMGGPGDGPCGGGNEVESEGSRSLGSGGVGGGIGGKGPSVKISSSKSLRQQNNMAYWLILKKKNDLQTKSSRTQELRVMLEKISAATGLANLEDFVPVMLEAEDENYSLFKLINELNKELEELEQDKSRLHDEIEQLSQTGKKSDQQKVKAGLQERIDRSRVSAEGYDGAYCRDIEVIKSIENSLMSVFNKVGASDEALSKQLISMGVTDRNIMLFLGLIEQQIEHVVQV
ncbi:unnamed protein product, partial [Choristocarpus tenellus]